jgi:CheY-like chemotaxis protein
VVLVADDDPSDLALAVRAVRKARPNAKIAEAIAGFEAGQKAATLRPDLVLLDLNLVGINGRRVCRLIRADGNLKGMKILAMSGEDDPGVKESVLESGADAFISKNAGWDEVARQVANLLQEKEAITK